MRLLVLVLLVWTAEFAWAHAVLVESSPAANAAVKGPDIAFNLRFNVRIDGDRSRLWLLSPDGNTAPLPIEKQPSPDRLQAHASGLKAGTYKLQWHVLASDGHMSKGEIPFTVN
ncbi:copper resistance CopC family protein [Candidatus Korobacter versatilis]|nr:copper resistance CopC family protein [Candidatus Koribacter versatilis]